MDADHYIEGLMASSHRSGVPFPEEEYHTRVGKVRKQMEAEGLDALLVTYPCNLYYVSGYYTFGVGNHACLILPLDGDAALQVTSMEIAAGVVNSWVKNIVSADWRGQAGAGEQLADMVKDMGLAAGRLGIEPSRPGLLPPVLESLKELIAHSGFGGRVGPRGSGAYGEVPVGAGLSAEGRRIYASGYKCVPGGDTAWSPGQ